MKSPSRVVVLTGAGISAESGLKTFRAEDGLWEDHRVEDVATPEAYDRDPDLVLRFYNERHHQVMSAEPNDAHRALARFEEDFGGEFLLVTQNIDDLHERAGSADTVHMHGELLKNICVSCDAVSPRLGDTVRATPCPSCGDAGGLRPRIVWFGEVPLELDRILGALARCDLFASIGTSGNVYPAAGFVQAAKAAGARCVELNLEPSAGAALFDDSRLGPASRTVPEYFEGLV